MGSINHILHNAKISNNCPECYASDGLEFVFSQRENENKFYAKAEKEISEKLHCSNCNTTIYPVNWDDDIERVYEYNKKQVTSLSTGFKLKPLAYIIIISDAILIGLLIYFFR